MFMYVGFVLPLTVKIYYLCNVNNHTAHNELKEMVKKGLVTIIGKSKP